MATLIVKQIGNLETFPLLLYRQQCTRLDTTGGAMYKRFFFVYGKLTAFKSELYDEKYVAHTDSLSAM